LITLAANAVQIGLVILAIVVATGLLTWGLRKRRRDVWHDLARARGLTFAERTDGPRVSGRLEGRTVEVSIDDVSSDRDLGGVEMIRIAVELEGVPREMTTEGVPGLIGDLAVLAERRIDFEQEPFHHNALVQGDEMQSRAYWTPSRQKTFLQLVETLPCDQVEIRDGRVIAELREIVSDRRRLEQILDGLLGAASSLDNLAGRGGK